MSLKALKDARRDIAQYFSSTYEKKVMSCTKAIPEAGRFKLTSAPIDN